MFDRLAASERRTENAFGTITDRLEELALQIHQERAKPEAPAPAITAVENAIRSILNHIEASENRTREQFNALQGRVAESQQAKAAATEAKLRGMEDRMAGLEARLKSADNSAQLQEVVRVVETHIADMNERIEKMKPASISSGK